ncbi:MAG TPA: hypothetical protein VED40_08320 [Azospirillaceae bacterium]|nr:hypothetical protein [Azospirillaceae bacterium]
MELIQSLAELLLPYVVSVVTVIGTLATIRWWLARNHLSGRIAVSLEFSSRQPPNTPALPSPERETAE